MFSRDTMREILSNSLVKDLKEKWLDLSRPKQTYRGSSDPGPNSARSRTLRWRFQANLHCHKSPCQKTIDATMPFVLLESGYNRGNKDFMVQFPTQNFSLKRRGSTITNPFSYIWNSKAFCSVMQKNRRASVLPRSSTFWNWEIH